MPESKEILDDISKFIADEIEKLQGVNPNLTGTEVSVTITPDAVSGYRSEANSRSFYFHGQPAHKIAPLHCPACLEKTATLVYSLNNTVPVCETCNKS